GGEHIPRAIDTVRKGGRVVAITAGLPTYAKKYGPWLGVLVFGLAIAWLIVSARVRRGVRLSLITRKPSGANLAKLADVVERGGVRAVIDRVFALDEAVEAHRYLETGRARGKVVLEVG